ncbi:MAG: LysR family transcriptional regulator [Bilifractor sp.]|jgi:DNA-binding transcriptional LysR family regulator
MNLTYLREFSTLAETMNFWEASEQLYMNESTLSKHIRAMERELGVQLFDRNTRNVRLTRYGKVLLPYAREISRLEIRYQAELGAAARSEHGTVTVGCIPAIPQYGITDFLLGFRTMYPQYDVCLLEADSHDLPRLLRERRCDIAILRESGSEPDLVAEPFIRDYLTAVFPAGHPLAEKESISAAELRDERIATLPAETYIYDRILGACAAAGVTPNIVFTSHHIDAILDMVVKGGCTALLMDRHVPSAENNTPYRAVRIVPLVTTEILICRRKEENISPAGDAFFRYFHQKIKELL